MWTDEVVEDVRQARQARAAAHDHNLKSIFCELKKRQDESNRKVVTLEPVLPPAAKRTAGGKAKP
jgi:hypothetical protein